MAPPAWGAAACACSDRRRLEAAAALDATVVRGDVLELEARVVAVDGARDLLRGAQAQYNTSSSIKIAMTRADVHTDDSTVDDVAAVLGCQRELLERFA